MIGKLVMAQAAKHLASVTLGLGGKSAAIVDASANLALAASNIMWSKFANSGQTCIAPDYVYVHESVKDKLLALCRAEITKAYGVGLAAQRTSPNLAHVVNERHTQRIKGLLDDAAAKGANTIIGGEVSEQDCFVQPTLLDNVAADSRILNEEIFGPLLPIITYTEIQTVIDKINQLIQCILFMGCLLS